MILLPVKSFFLSRSLESLEIGICSRDQITAGYYFREIDFCFPTKETYKHLSILLPHSIYPKSGLKVTLKIFDLFVYQIKVSNGGETVTANFNQLVRKYRSNSYSESKY